MEVLFKLKMKSLFYPIFNFNAHEVCAPICHRIYAHIRHRIYALITQRIYLHVGHWRYAVMLAHYPRMCHKIYASMRHRIYTRMCHRVSAHRRHRVYAHICAIESLPLSVIGRMRLCQGAMHAHYAHICHRIRVAKINFVTIPDFRWYCILD